MKVLTDHATGDELIAERRALGIDRHDEVWAGIYRVNAAPRGGHADLVAQLIVLFRELTDLRVTDGVNVGHAGDYRIPDVAVHAEFDPDLVYYPTLAMAAEVISPDEDAYAKIGFYEAHGLVEVLLVFPAERRLEVLSGTRQQTRSRILAVDVDELTSRIDWQ